ncbi:vitellogenin-2-like [Uloborus diversus]|uniref:vitellogenin-2-like n=1 Tax=Uloborus diversus TaxID=327109 RepID=UPI00240930C6|nr:vitellogenin-2-like [Uloborus diversus]
MIGLALTFVALAATAAATGYIDGREYVYKYTGNIHTGYPRIKSQFSGYAFKSDLIIQPHGDYAFLKVDHVQKAQFNDEFEDVRRFQHAYSPMPPHAEFLTRPFKVHRKNGVITHIEVTKDEPAFSVNLKRGLASLFNLNFDQYDSGSNNVEDNDIHRPDPDAHYYKINEEGILGECETAYVIEHHPYYKTPHNNIVLNVTKVKNYHKCSTRPSQVYSVFHGHECGKAPYEKAHTLHGNGHYHYDIRGDRHHYVIEQIRTEGEVAYTPYPLEGQTVSTVISRHLQLVEERPVTTSLDTGAEYVSHRSLVYDFDHQRDFKETIDLKQPHYLYFLTGRKVPVSEVHHQVDELLTVYQDESYQEKIKDKNFPAKFVELVRSVSTLGYEEINELYTAYGDVPKTGATEQQKRSRNLFVDVLVSVGTNPAFEFGKHLLQSKLFRPQEAIHFITQLQFHTKEVSQSLLDSIQELCDSVKKHQQLHVACAISLGNIIHDHCVAKYHPEGDVPQGKNTCPLEAAVKYFEYIAQNYESSTDEKLKAAYVKVAGNLGVKEAFHYIRPYVEGQGSHHRFYRDNAIWALKNLGFRYPDKVRDLLVPLLFNQTEHYELRLAAFTLLMMYRPALYEIEGLARALKYDRDDQVRSFVYSTFKSLVNSTHPCDRKISNDVHYALRILDEVHHEFEHYDYTYSQHHYVGGYDHDYDFGGSTRFAYFASDTGYIPRTVYLGVDDFIGGKAFQTFGIGVKQFGLEKFLDKIIGPEGSFGKRSFFDLFKKRARRDVSGVEKELNEIKGKLKLPVHDYEPILGEIFFKYMGNHLQSFFFDEHTFEDFFKEGRFVIPNLPALYQTVAEFTYQRFILSVDQYYIIPSESGVPIIFDYKQPVYFHHHNKESSLKVEPGFFPEDRGGKFPNSIKASTDGHFAVDKQLFATMGVWIPFDQVVFGGGINRRATVSLPLKLSLELIYKDKKVKTHWTPVAPHEVYHFKYEPFTFVDSYVNTIPRVLEQGYKPVRKVHHHEEETHYLHDTFGVGFDVKADYENEFNDFGSFLDFFFEKDYRQKFYYLFANPHFSRYDVNVQFSHAKEGATKQVDTEFTYKYYDEDYTSPHLTQESFEPYAKPEDRGQLYTCALEAEVTATGDKERKLEGEITWARNLRRCYHKVNFYYKRTPFTSDDTRTLKVCGSSYLKYPKYDLIKLATLNTIDLDHTVQSELKAHFGKDCSSDQKIKVQGHFEETEEQKEFEKRREEPDTPEHYNEYSHYYHECQKERARGLNYGENCWKYMEVATTVHKYNFDVKYEHLSNRFLNFTYKVGGFLRHLLHNHADHNMIDVHNPEGELHFSANFSSKLPVADIHVVKPHVVSNYYNVYFPRYHGFRTFPDFEEYHIKNSFSDIYCDIEGDHVTTFDKYEYTLPPIDCYKVIARDCSPNEHFTILATKITHPKYHKAVKVFLGKHKIEALPVSEDSEIIVRVDGKRVSVTGNEPYFHRETEEAAPDFYITFRDFYYALHSEKYGLIVEYDGHAISIQVSPFYRNKLCGLCGNYNGQKYDGYTNADGCYYEDEKAYAYAYAIPSDTCTVPQAELKCPAEDGFGCTKLRTKVLQLSSGKVPQTCFSTEPVPECTAHCKSRGTITRQVSFHCLPAKDDSTKALLRQQQSRVLYEVRRKSHDHEAAVEIPDGCQHE